jgi:hypothetical protein
MAGSLLPLQIIESVFSMKCGKMISHECEWAFRYQFFAAGALWIGIGQKILLKPLTLAFCNLKSKFLFNLKINISSSMERKTYQLIAFSTPVISRWTIPLI